MFFMWKTLRFQNLNQKDKNGKQLGQAWASQFKQ